MRGLDHYRDRGQRIAHEFGFLDWKGFLCGISVATFFEWCWYFGFSGPRVDDWRWSQLLAFQSLKTTTPQRAKEFSVFPEADEKSMQIDPDTFWGVTGVEVRHG